MVWFIRSSLSTTRRLYFFQICAEWINDLICWKSLNFYLKSYLGNLCIETLLSLKCSVLKAIPFFFLLKVSSVSQLSHFWINTFPKFLRFKNWLWRRIKEGVLSHIAIILLCRNTFQIFSLSSLYQSKHYQIVLKHCFRDVKCLLGTVHRGEPHICFSGWPSTLCTVCPFFLPPHFWLSNSSSTNQ